MIPTLTRLRMAWLAVWEGMHVSAMIYFRVSFTEHPPSLVLHASASTRDSAPPLHSFAWCTTCSSGWSKSTWVYHLIQRPMGVYTVMHHLVQGPMGVYKVMHHLMQGIMGVYSVYIPVHLHDGTLLIGHAERVVDGMLQQLLHLACEGDIFLKMLCMCMVCVCMCVCGWCVSECVCVCVWCACDLSLPKFPTTCAKYSHENACISSV